MHIINSHLEGKPFRTMLCNNIIFSLCLCQNIFSTKPDLIDTDSRLNQRKLADTMYSENGPQIHSISVWIFSSQRRSGYKVLIALFFPSSKILSYKKFVLHHIRPFIYICSYKVIKYRPLLQ